MIMDVRRVADSKMTGIFFSALLLVVWSHPTEGQLSSVYSWKSLDFAYPSTEARETAINNGDFIPGVALPIDMDTYPGDQFGDRVFISIPRLQDGIPATLGYVTNDSSSDSGPAITPFPSWDWQNTNDSSCDSLTSVWRMQIDRCGRLWVMDTGKLVETQHCPPQLLSFSLTTNELLSRYKIPEDQYVDLTHFVLPVVDVRGDQCEDTFVYIADPTGFAIVVYDHQNTRSWRITNNLFYPSPMYGTFNIDDIVYDLMDGVLGMALSPLDSNEDKTLYFHAMSSLVESYVLTSVIRNYTLFEDNSAAAARSFVPYLNERSTQSAAETMDENGVAFFGLLSEMAIGCWNSANDYGDEFIDRVAVNQETLQFPSGMKVITATDGRQELWAITVSFQRFMTGVMTTNETNFRIQSAVIDDLVSGTKCDVS